MAWPLLLHNLAICSNTFLYRKPGYIIYFIFISIANCDSWWRTALQAICYSMADGESKKISGTCAHCQKPATSTCVGCREAPLYDESFIESTFYCNSKCLKAGWAQHRSRCRKLQARKSLARAAMLLQAVVYLFRLHASTLRFKSLRLEGSTIFLDGFQFAESQSHESERALKPFPVPFDGDGNLAEAVLVYTGSVEAMMYLHSFADELLDGKLQHRPCSVKLDADSMIRQSYLPESKTLPSP